MLGQTERQYSVYGLGKHGFHQKHKEREIRVRRGGGNCMAAICRCFRSERKHHELPEYETNMFVWELMSSWKGTALPLVFKKPYYWLMVALHVTMVILEEQTETDLFESVNGGVIAIPTSLLIFFIVFYASQCYNRFFTMFMHTVGIGGTSMVWVGLVKLHITDDRNVQWNTTRYILAAIHVLYYELDDGMDEDDWETIRGRKLLTQQEVQVCDAYAGFAPWLLISWALREVQLELQRGPPETDRWRCGAFQQFEQLAIELRSHCGQIKNLLKQPVPWAYFHLLNLMTVLVLILMAVGFVGMASAFMSTLSFACITLMLIGLKELAVAMADPFGDDEVDFKLEKFLAMSYRDALSHLQSQHEPCGSYVADEVMPPRPQVDLATVKKQSSLMVVDAEAEAEKRVTIGGVLPGVSVRKESVSLQDDAEESTLGPLPNFPKSSSNVSSI